MPQVQILKQRRHHFRYSAFSPPPLRQVPRTFHRALLLSLSLSFIISQSLSAPQNQNSEWSHQPQKTKQTQQIPLKSNQALPDAELETSSFGEISQGPGQFDRGLDSLINSLDSTTGKEEAADTDDAEADADFDPDSEADAWAASDKKWGPLVTTDPVQASDPSAVPDAELDTSATDDVAKFLPTTAPVKAALHPNDRAKTVDPTALPDMEFDASASDDVAYTKPAASVDPQTPLKAVVNPVINPASTVDFTAVDPGALKDEEVDREMFEDRATETVKSAQASRLRDPFESTDYDALPDEERDSKLFEEAEKTKATMASSSPVANPTSSASNSLPDVELDTSAFLNTDAGEPLESAGSGTKKKVATEQQDDIPLRGPQLVSQGMEDTQIQDSTLNSLDSQSDASNPLFDRPDPELDGPLPTDGSAALNAAALNSDLGSSGSVGVLDDDTDPEQDLGDIERSMEKSVADDGDWEVPQNMDRWRDALGDYDSSINGASFQSGSLEFSKKWLQAYKSFLVGQDRKRFQRYRVVKTWVPGPRRSNHPKMRTITIKRLKKKGSRSHATNTFSSKSILDAKGMRVGELRPVPDDLLRGSGSVLGGASGQQQPGDADVVPEGELVADGDASSADGRTVDDPDGAMGVKVFEEMAAEAAKEANLASQTEGGSEGTASGVPKMKVALQQPITLPWCAKRTPYNNQTAFARFDMYGCIKISGIHTGQTYLKTVIIIDRTDANNTRLKLPETNQNAYGEELTLTGADPAQPAEERALNVKSNVFCSTGQFMPDGTLLSIGGSSDSTNADPLLNGSFAIRAFKPCDNKTCDFQLVGSMTTKRWYPTAQIMPDGRVLIVGGANVYGNIALNTPSKNNPTVEYYPRKPGEKDNYYVPFLESTVPYNLYAFVHVLPSGLVFIYAGDRYTLFDPTTNQEVPGNYPQLNATAENGVPIYRSYPISGTSALFPLSPANNHSAEIMVCGGNNAKATIVYGNGGASRNNGMIPADYYCWRITPESKNPVWIPEKMCRDPPKCTQPLRRVMGDMVLLADGNVLIINGAATGYQGLKQDYASEAQLAPLIYLTKTHSWYPQNQLPDSLVPRMYHSSALLLHDCTVLISGSNPNPYLWPGGKFPTEFRMEKFIPPYLMNGRVRPVVTEAPRAITVNTDFAVYFNAPLTPSTNLLTRFEVNIAYPGFSTHNQRHGMRHVNLFVKNIIRVNTKGAFVAIVHSPPNLNIAPPTMYWLHVLDNGVPNVEGRWINVTASTRSGK